jgi:AraC-like DNA-binding protein
MAIEFDTESVIPSQRLSFWQDAVCDAFVELDCASSDRESFQGKLSQSHIGTISCTQISSRAQTVRRTPARIAKATDEFVLIALEIQGRNGVFQDERETVIGPGQFVIYDTTRPYELRFDAAFSQTVFQLPKELLRQRIGTIDMLTAVPFVSERPLERLAYDFLLSLSKTAGKVDDEAGLRLADQALDIVAMAVADRLQSGPATPSVHRTMMLYRLQRFIVSRLSDPELSLSQTGAALQVTPRYINSLLADEQTSFSRYVLAKRLERCRNMLADPNQAHRRIGEIAYGWGFNDLVHFSHKFKERYGVSPREYRLSYRLN